MRDDAWVLYGALGWASAVMLFAIGALLIGERPGFDTAGAEIANWFGERRTWIAERHRRRGGRSPAGVVPRDRRFAGPRRGPGAGRAGTVALACGLAGS